MNEHSPGDWRVSGTSIVTDEYCIAVIEDDGGYEAPAEQRQANARLIAAAPRIKSECAGLLCDVAQLLDGWHADGTAWTEWDESIRIRVTELQRFLDI